MSLSEITSNVESIESVVSRVVSRVVHNIGYPWSGGLKARCTKACRAAVVRSVNVLHLGQSRILAPIQTRRTLSVRQV